ncbi:conjugal transfer protein TraA [Alcaligenes faecalis]|uniref:Conjugal transfer protein TraA n=2 Tax=Alcaligenes faecalis TaxID=511 RepID=A0A1Z3MKS8_ALCFA|nr:TraA family conjugative transfer protein [Alcaligenes faecalis]ASD48414.1 conjugal transfer protein TraA [Alcaligenes faecalis]OSZ33075.1 conjugal transfer protein TraA [Alcaligenes faecalis]OSZ41215.1 conjugal transfer protein TraA [Alcaligenes faecalis]
MSIANISINTGEDQYKRHKQILLFVVLMVAMFLLAVNTSHAGAGGLEFEEIWQTLKEWTQGTLGRIIAGAMILIGIIGGIARQSLIAFALGIGGGIGLYNAPDIIESILSATLEHAAAISTTVHHLGNGLGI